MEVEMYEAPPEMAQYVNGVCAKLKEVGKGNLTVSMSLAISLCAQIFLSCGGDIDKGEEIGEAVKQGVITTLDAYKDLNKTRKQIKRRMN